jgi:hypothetical protein
MVKSGGDFYMLQSGSNKVRIVSELVDRGTHFSASEKRSFTCLGKDEGCKFCASGDKPRVKFLMWVIDRRDGSIKLADFGYSIVKAVSALQQDEDYTFENIPDFDIKIVKSGEGMNTEYTVTPSPKTALTEDEQTKVLALESIDSVAENLKEKGKPSVVPVAGMEDVPFV